MAEKKNEQNQSDVQSTEPPKTGKNGWRVIRILALFISLIIFTVGVYLGINYFQGERFKQKVDFEVAAQLQRAVDEARAAQQADFNKAYGELQKSAQELSNKLEGTKQALTEARAELAKYKKNAASAPPPAKAGVSAASGEPGTQAPPAAKAAQSIRQTQKSQPPEATKSKSKTLPDRPNYDPNLRQKLEQGQQGRSSAANPSSGNRGLLLDKAQQPPFQGPK